MSADDITAPDKREGESGASFRTRPDFIRDSARAWYDVFLSSRSEDTWASFTSHLYSSLSNAGIVVFKDDADLVRGNHISVELPLGIERSTISIIILSKDYAGSRGCLNELSKIMQLHRALGRIVLPVFYGVDPSEVCNQMSSFGLAFRDLIQRISPTEDEVSRWRTDLSEVAGIADFVLLNSKSESEDIKKIVDHVCEILDKKDLFIPAHPVGVDSRLQNLIKPLESYLMDGFLVLGICGPGGVGKTTLAKAIYNQIGRKFEGRSFLSNIREVWGKDNGPVILQRQLLSEICKTTMMETHSIDSGKAKLKESLCHKRALVVLDNVDKSEQLNALCGSHEWFGLGSIIIITARYRLLLKLRIVDRIYEMKTMNECESIELFSWHAFKQSSPKKEFRVLSKNIVDYCGGLPLALEVLDSYLSDREEQEWKTVLDKLGRFPEDGIQNVLKISFDGLKDTERDIFLDISCFFIGMDRGAVTQILDGSGLSPNIGINVLVARSLVTIDEKNKLGMHDLLQDMGKEIASKSSPEEHRKAYDVFLSFRGEDTRASFTSHLYSSLSDAGIVVFKDDTNLPRGNSISVELPLGIELSTISIIIFSKGYAGSRWCLNELSKIMQLHRAEGRVVLPVFYGVNPFEVRKQISSFGEAFQDLIQRSSPTEDEVSRWRIDFREVGGIAGFVVVNSRNESEDIKKIVDHVCKIFTKKDLFIADHPVGVDSRLQDLIEISESHSMDVLLLGIWGMGGVGKTTIAKAIYNEIGWKFENKSFLSNIREVWDQDNGPVNLQRQLLSEICRTTMMEIHSIDSGKAKLKESLCRKKALVVLDDVNKDEQLDALFGCREWFGPGSKIIITTRDEHPLRLHKVDHVYTMENMNECESIELFSWHAFKQPSPKKEFKDFSQNIVAYCGGLPLALKVLGSYLFDREEEEWRSVQDKLKEIPNGEIQKKLKISFDCLDDDTEREIFLHISCFFIGMDRGDVTQILYGSGLFPDIGTSVLVERSLVTVDEKNKLGMHDLLRDMGREIIREQSPKELGKRSRLWFHKDVLDVLSKHTGTESVEGLALNLSHADKECFSTKAFKKMKTLRFLLLGNVELDGDYKYISRDLRWLCWHGFPLKYFSANFYQKNLVSIELRCSRLERFWREPQLLERLKILNCSDSLSLIQTPNFSKLPNLEKLILKNCPKLSTVHPTIGHASKLLLINLKHCTSLRTLPRSIYSLKSLKTLILSGCTSIEKLEEDIGQMDSLTTLIADNTAITQVPLSLVRLRSVGFISLCGYRGLSRDVFPSLIRSRMSPTNNPLSLIPTYAGTPISSDLLNSNIPGPSSICNKLANLQSLVLENISENDPEIIGGAAKIWESFCARICMDMATMPNSSKILEIESSVLSGHHSQADVSRSENYLRHLVIKIGKDDQVTASLLENISQGLTARNYDDDCVLPGDNYPYWQSFKGEGASVKFKLPRVSGCDLKGMIICCVYFPSGDLGDKACESCISLMIINYTKTTTLHFRQESLTSFEEAEWKEIISNLDSDDQVEVIVVFGNGFTMKRTAVYLKYYESFDEQLEHQPSPKRRRKQ